MSQDHEHVMQGYNTKYCVFCQKSKDEIDREEKENNPIHRFYP